MKVAVNFSHFTGFIGMTGNELDVVSKVLARAVGTDTSYLGGREVHITNDDKMKVSFVIDAAAEVMSQANYDLEHAELESIANAKAIDESAARAVLVTALIADFDNQALRDQLSVMLQDHDLIRYHECHTSNPHYDWSTNSAGNVVVFKCGRDSHKKAVALTLDGEFTKTDL